MEKITESEKETLNKKLKEEKIIKEEIDKIKSDMNKPE